MELITNEHDKTKGNTFHSIVMAKNGLLYKWMRHGGAISEWGTEQLTVQGLDISFPQI